MPKSDKVYVIGRPAFRVFFLVGRTQGNAWISLDSSPCRPRFLGVEELLVAATGWGTSFPDGDGWFGRATQQHQRDGVTADVVIRSRAARLLEYLEAVHGMREQPVRDIAEYQDRCWWAGDIPADPSCVLTATRDEAWAFLDDGIAIARRWPMVNPQPQRLVPAE